MADKDGKERAQIMSQRIRDLDMQIYDLEKTTETYTTRKILFFGGKTKERELPPDVIEARQAQAEELKQKKDSLMRYSVYAERVLAAKYWNGPYSPEDLKDEQKNVLEKHQTYYKTIASDETGTPQRVIGIKTYEKQQNEYGTSVSRPVMKYYPIDVRKVGSPKVGMGLRWEVVPDKEHELKGYQEK